MTNPSTNYSDFYSQMNFQLSLLKLAANTAEEANSSAPEKTKAASFGVREVLWEDTREVEALVAQARQK